MLGLVEKGLNVDRLPLLESLMSIGNGYMGTRAYLEEFIYKNSIRGNYINAIYERIPMIHAEWAHGFPSQVDRMPNLIDLFHIRIFLDGEKLILEGDIRDFKRKLDFEDGVLYRSYKYYTKDGKLAKLNFESLVSFTHIQHRTWSLNIDYEGEIKVVNTIDFNIENMVNKNDPRIASSNIPLVELEEARYDLSRGKIGLKTINSHIKLEVEFLDHGRFDVDSKLEDEALVIVYSARGNLQIKRLVKYWDSIRDIRSDFLDREYLYREQIVYLKNYREKTAIEFLDNRELNNAIDFMRFHLLQASTRDEYGNISAKGLSGEGYEGHYFWDTEIFLFPVWLLWDRERARNLLLYRHRLLDIARERAKEMGNLQGACYAWRTISGIESSGYFPAGSAQYHINFDIAYTFIQWWLVEKDLDFLIKYSMEVLLETARTALEIGNFESDGFHIHTVTGPDEYTALVSDNYYTNKMAQYNLKWTVKLWQKLEKESYNDWLEIKNKLNIGRDEIKRMKKAAESMVFIYDKEKKIAAQDSSFFQKARWPKENNLRPLLLNYHPLNIYRYQILKQADTVLAQYLIDDESEELMKNTFYYYEERNTHDSSLSRSITGLMASRLKDEKLAYESFMDSLYMDLKDLHGNTIDGLHMANIGGSILSLIKGFGGLRIKEEGLHINPQLPKKLGRIRFRFTWRQTLLEALIQEEDIHIKKIYGPSVEIILKGEKVTIGQRAVLFDLDGVLTGTSDNHFQAWHRMMKELGYDLPEDFRDQLRGVSRMKSIDLILEYFGLEVPLEEKIKMTDKKNQYYKKSISSFSSDNLYPGVIGLLDKLKEKNVKIGLVSASKNAKELIKNMGIEKYFDGIADPKKVKKGKPHPDPFLLGAEILDVDPKDCLGVEDAQVGIESINSAKMLSIGIGDKDLKGADFLYSTIEEASDFIIDWAEG